MMTPLEFAKKHFKEYSQKGAELIPAYCPFCHGGKSSDKYTFALNMENETYNCKRGTCNQSGHFVQLLKHFGENEREFEFKRPAKKYIVPKTQIQPAGEKVTSYLKLRGISRDIWEHYGVGEVAGNIAFPYYDEIGKLVLVKFRKAEKYTGKGQKAWREEGGKAVFWGMNKCVSGKPLVICEGEMDMLALAECGIINVVSVPSGAEDLSCIDNCWNWLQQFRKIIIWPDNDEPGQEMCRKLIVKLGSWRCAVVESEYKDANECLFKSGADGVLDAFNRAADVPIAGLVRLADVSRFTTDGLTRIKSSVAKINKYIAGYMGGQVSIWTGDSGSGKSTFVGQELLEAIEHGFAVCAYSGELPASLFKYWIDLQAAGYNNLKSKHDAVRDELVYYPDPEKIPAINEWYSDKFYLCDNFSEDITEGNVLELFEYAYRRYDCKVFLIDNLMSMTLDGADSDYYRQQSRFLQQSKQFAKKFDVHVHIVAHPRKAEGRITKSDIAGSKNITNWADNVFGVHRVGENDREVDKQFDTIIDALKCRFTGVVNKSAGLMFDERSKRFSSKDDPRRDFQYRWERK